MTSNGETPDATPPPFPVDVDALLKNPSMYRAYSNLLIGHRGQARQYGDMQEKTEALQQQVSAALADLRRRSPFETHRNHGVKFPTPSLERVSVEKVPGTISGFRPKRHY